MGYDIPENHHGSLPKPAFTLDEKDQELQDMCVLPMQMDARTWMREYLRRQIEWSEKTFGPGERTEGLLKHIEKEFAEIREHPHDLEEWIDIIILALDGAWRSQFLVEGVQASDVLPDVVMDMLDFKQDKNMNRKWPAPGGQDQAIEHIREEEA